MQHVSTKGILVLLYIYLAMSNLIVFEVFLDSENSRVWEFFGIQTKKGWIPFYVRWHIKIVRWKTLMRVCITLRDTAVTH